MFSLQSQQPTLAGTQHVPCAMHSNHTTARDSQWLLSFSFQQTGSHTAAKRQDRTERKKGCDLKYGVSPKYLLETDWNLWVKSFVCPLLRDPAPFIPPEVGWVWTPQCSPWISPLLPVNSLAADDKGLGKANFLTGNQKNLNTNKKMYSFDSNNCFNKEQGDKY